jgi:hypothetical protein
MGKMMAVSNQKERQRGVKTKTAPKVVTKERKPKKTVVALLGNQNAVGNDGGRPRAYEDHAAFDALVEEYFAKCVEDGRKPTLTGISLHLGFCDKETFGSYHAVSFEFARTVNKARMRIEENRHQLLVNNKTFTPGIIFDLKNNHGWKDKTETEFGVSNDLKTLLATVSELPRLAP